MALTAAAVAGHIAISISTSVFGRLPDVERRGCPPGGLQLGVRDGDGAPCVVLVPRHAERSGDVAAEIEERGLRWIRRSECVPPGNGSEPADIFLVDTTGELTHFYPHATVIFVGKSLRAKGGQNVIEPAWAVKPILVGPHMENFSVIIEEFLEAEAIVQVENVGALFQAVVELFDDPGKRDAMGQNALRLVGEKSGALSETVRIMESRLEGLPRSGQ